MAKRTKAKKKSVKKTSKKSQESKKGQSTTIMGMAYDEFGRYKKKTHIG